MFKNKKDRSPETPKSIKLLTAGVIGATALLGSGCDNPDMKNKIQESSTSQIEKNPSHEAISATQNAAAKILDRIDETSARNGVKPAPEGYTLNNSEAVASGRYDGPAFHVEYDPVANNVYISAMHDQSETSVHIVMQVPDDNIIERQPDPADISLGIFREALAMDGGVPAGAATKSSSPLVGVSIHLTETGVSAVPNPVATSDAMTGKQKATEGNPALTPQQLQDYLTTLDKALETIQKL